MLENRIEASPVYGHRLTSRAEAEERALEARRHTLTPGDFRAQRDEFESRSTAALRRLLDQIRSEGEFIRSIGERDDQLTIEEANVRLDAFMARLIDRADAEAEHFPPLNGE